MIDTLVAFTGIAASIGIGASVYYKLGRLEQKIEFLYNNCDIYIKFRNHNKEEDWNRNGIDRYKNR